MTNEEDISYAKIMMGFLPLKLARKALSFGTGDALLAGKIVDYRPTLIHVSPRRTVEGGSNLSDKWTKS
jgi:hypothetical protein